MKINSIISRVSVFVFAEKLFFRCEYAQGKFTRHDIYMHGVHDMSKVLLCLIFTVLHCASALEIKCVDVYDSLKRHVRNSHAWPVLQDVDACMSDAFIRKSLMYTNTSTLQISDGVFILTNDSLALAELLTFSLMGRHFDYQGLNKGFFFSWNRYYETLSLELLPCEFSRPLYNFVLLFTLLTILCILVMQMHVKAEASTSNPTSEEKGGSIKAVGFKP